MPTENFAQVAHQCQSMRGQAPHCGDGVWTYWHAQGLFGLLCDGAGHGLHAERIQKRAIEVAKCFVEASDVIDLVALFEVLHVRLKGMRGMVAVAFVLHADGGLDYVHIGDVSLCCFDARHAGWESNRSSEQQGIIGYHMPTPRLQHWQCQPGQWVVAHSDGIRRSTPADQWKQLLQSSIGMALSRLSLRMIQQLADGRDDACCLVLRYWGERKPMTCSTMHASGEQGADRIGVDRTGAEEKP